MKIFKIFGITVLVILAAVTLFHIAHYFLYCRYREVPGKNHCAVCGHRRVCGKYHHRH